MTFKMTKFGRVREFANRTEALRWISKNRQFGGHHLPVHMIYMPTDSGDAGYCHYHWTFGHDMSFDEYKALARVQQRYRQYHHYVTEIDAQWRNDGPRQGWADNSVEQAQVNRHGQRRTVMLVAPGGDACF